MADGTAGRLGQPDADDCSGDHHLGRQADRLGGSGGQRRDHRLGTASTGYAQNMAFNKNAFGLVVLPMVKPPGAVQVARESYKGLSVRLIPYYTGSTDTSAWRLDVLYGKKTLDPRLACRVAG
jgi:hypothetical protein